MKSYDIKLSEGTLNIITSALAARVKQLQEWIQENEWPMEPEVGPEFKAYIEAWRTVMFDTSVALEYLEWCSKKETP